MDKVISKDGTAIAYDRSGIGTPLILVHGTNADHTRWANVRPYLARHFTVYAVDRRGRGESGDGPDYSIEREYEDIAAVAGAIAGPVDVLGHSFGAACVLGAARQISNLRRLVLYEPPMLQVQHSPQRAALLDEMERHLAAGRRGEVVRLLLGMLGVPGPAVDQLSASPAWPGMTAAAHSIPRELRQSAAYAADQEAFKAITAPTLFVLGGDSPEFFRVTTETLCQGLPNAKIVELPGQQHSAMLTAPELFARMVIRFLEEDRA